MNYNFPNNVSKEVVFETVNLSISELNFKIVQQDSTRPWGGFFVIDENQAKDFAAFFFPNLELSEIQVTNKLSPKILIVAPNKRLSWQYHFRRSEIWKIVDGVVGIKTSLTDEEGELQQLVPGTFIKMEKGERHRLIGLDSWGIVAEIWQHTEIENPSDENDIVRVQDDFGR